MPVYTHYQAAVPITYGHYLQGIAFALLRDIRRLILNIEEMNICPLGACAVGGTSIPIDNFYVAEMLGFTSTCKNSIDAVASRDIVLSILAHIAILSTNISRLSTDLQFWSSSETKYFNLPDEVVGSSSIMPNKRNAFVLENIQGKCANVGSNFAAAQSGFQKTPFSNSIAVGTEAINTIWQSFKEIEESVVLLEVFVENAVPVESIMLDSAIRKQHFCNRVSKSTGHAKYFFIQTSS